MAASPSIAPPGDVSMITADEVVTGTEVLRHGWCEVTGMTITGVGAGPAPRPPDIALGPVTVAPGFVDMHVHGGGGGAFPDATADSSARAVELHRSRGTTTMLASLVAASPDLLLHQVEVLADQVRSGLIAGIHLEGPWLSAHRCGAHDPAALRPPDRAEIDTLLTAAAGAITMVTLAPELPGALDLIPVLVDSGVVVAVGHTDADYDTTRKAIDVGATVGTHLFNAMRPIHQREPGPVIALVESPGVTVEIIGDGIHVHPALYRDIGNRVGPNRVALITDAMAGAGMPDGSYRLGGLPVDVSHGTATLSGTDTIAGSTATMDRAFRFAVEHCGLPRDEALLLAARQTSINPARAVGLSRSGVRTGAMADLVVLSPDLSVDRVLLRGSWLPSPATT